MIPQLYQESGTILLLIAGTVQYGPIIRALPFGLDLGAVDPQNPRAVRSYCQC